MRCFDTILWDVDNTLLDFDLSEREAIAKSFDCFGLSLTEEIRTRYSAINRGMWEKLERKEITKQEVLTGRFRILFEELGMQKDAAFVEAFQKDYQENLANVFFYRDDSDKLMKKLKEEGYKQYFVTNGVASTQHTKLSLSGLDLLADGMFISEEIGVEKPDVLFFEKSFARIKEMQPDFAKDRAILVGDSLSSDMKGALAAGVCACWYNPKRKEHPARKAVSDKQTKERLSDYEITNLWELYKILETEE